MKHREIFKSPQFLERPAVKAMQEEHKKGFGGSIHPNGYPDLGNGRYSAELPYENWLVFNNAQRAHYNMIEVSGPALACVVTGGLYYPTLCGGLGIVFAIGRVLYSIGYNSKRGASGRLAGAVVGSISLYGLFGTNLFVGAKMIKELYGF